jgi:hypothetical protein
MCGCRAQHEILANHSLEGTDENHEEFQDNASDLRQESEHGNLPK